MALDFDAENGTDPTDLLGKLHQITLPYDPSQVPRWINRLEIKMESYGVLAQWSKRVVLENNLPQDVQNDLNELLAVRKSKASTTIYKECKTLLLKLRGPKEEETFKAAQNLVLTDKPSSAAKELWRHERVERWRRR